MKMGKLGRITVGCVDRCSDNTVSVGMVRYRELLGSEKRKCMMERDEVGHSREEDSLYMLQWNGVEEIMSTNLRVSKRIGKRITGKWMKWYKTE